MLPFTSELLSCCQYFNYVVCICSHCYVPKRISSGCLDCTFTHSPSSLFSLPIGAKLLSLVRGQDLISCQSKQFSQAYGKSYNNILSLETSTYAAMERGRGTGPLLCGKTNTALFGGLWSGEHTALAVLTYWGTTENPDVLQPHPYFLVS